MGLNFDFTKREEKKLDPIKVSIKNVIKEALNNWGKLACNRGKGGCKYFYDDEDDYEGDETRCVIGIGLQYMDRSKISINHNRYGVHENVRKGLFIVDPNELSDLNMLQDIHDKACRTADPKNRASLIDSLHDLLLDLQKKYLTSSSN